MSQHTYFVDGTGADLGKLKEIIRRLNGDPYLGKIFGHPVSASLRIVSVGGRLAIEDTGRVPLSDGQLKCFSKTLSDTMWELEL